MRAVHITGGFVFVAFLAGAYVGTTSTESRIAMRCIAGERMRIAHIEVRCPARPTWGDR